MRHIEGLEVPLILASAESALRAAKKSCVCRTNSGAGKPADLTVAEG
jgi:hypothetical protein